MPRLNERALGLLTKRNLGISAAVVGLGTLAAGAGIGHEAHRMTSPGKQRHTPILDALFEGVIGDAQADRDILGTDIGITDILPLPSMFRDPFRNFELINQKTWGQITNDDTMRRANSDYDAFTQRQAEQWQKQQYDYQATGRGYDLGATGDMVFGMWNSRQGF